MKGMNSIMKNGSKIVCSNKWLNAVGSLFAACMLFMNMDKPDFKPVSSVKLLNYILECLMNMSNTFDDVFVQTTIVCVAFVVVSKKIGSIKIERLKFSRISSLFIAIMWTFGKSFNMTNDLHLLVSSPGQLLKAIMFGWGSYYIFYNLLHLFYYFLEKRPDFVPKDIKLKSGKSIKLTEAFDLWNKHPIAFPFIFLLIVWGPYVILSYPGNMCYDSYNEICQYLEIWEFTSHHPPFYTVMLGIFVRIGRNIFHSANVGLFMYILYQYVISALIMSYTIYVMAKLKAPLWLKVSSLFIYGFMPHFSSYVAVAVKDYPYCIVFVLFITQIIRLFVEKDKFWTYSNIAITVISMTGSFLLRNNGKHVIIPLIAVMIIKFIVDFRNKKPEFSSKRLAQGITMLIIPIILANLLTGFMKQRYDISDGSIREALSLPFQQTARYVRDYGDEVTPDERAAIDAILDYDKLSELYNERISDPVKGRFNINSTTADLINYLKVWAIQFTKHPVCYFEATLNQNYYIVYPFVNNLNMYTVTKGNYYGNATDDFEKTGINEYKPFTNIQLVITKLHNFISKAPFLNLLCSISFYILLLFCLLIYALNKKSYNFIIASIPLIMTVLVIIASPVIMGHPRYAFPIAYTIPLFIAYYFHENSKQKTAENSATRHGKTAKFKVALNENKH